MFSIKKTARNTKQTQSLFKPVPTVSKFGQQLVTAGLVTLIASGLLVNILAWSRNPESSAAEEKGNSSSLHQAGIAHDGLPRELERGVFFARRSAAIQKLAMLSSGPSSIRDREICHQEILFYLEPDSVEYAEHLSSYADTLVNSGNYKQADNFYRKVIDIYVQKGAARSKRSEAMLRLACLCHSRGRIDEEMSLRRRVVDGDV